MHYGEKQRFGKDGVIVRLFKKLTPNHSCADNQDFKYLVWSYFDGMNFEKVENISDFYTHKNLLNSERDLNRFYEEQHLNLYLSSQEEQESSEEFLKGSKTDKLPLISLTEIKISDEDVAKRGLCDLEKKIREKINGQMSGWEDHFDCQVYRSLGYGEFVIIARSTAYGHIFDMISLLNDFEVTWSTYTILGVIRESDCLKEWDNPFNGTVSIRLTNSLRGDTGIIMERLQKHFGADIASTTSLSCNAIFGKYDFEIIIGDGINPISTRKVIDLFQNGILSPNSPVYRDNILLTHTRWLYKDHINKYGDKGKTPVRKSGVQKNGTDLINNLNKIYENRLAKFFPKTLRLPFRELSYSYERLIQSFYNCSQLYEMEEIIRTLFYLMLESIGYKQEQICNLIEQEDSSIDVKESGPLLDAGNLALTISLLSDYIMDMLHSSRPFFEIMNQNVKFSGYIAKIIMAYSSIIDAIEIDVEKCIKSQGQNNELHSRLNFFLSVHISHEVNSYMLFPKSSDRPDRRLIAIKCDTTSLFDVETAICYIAHEIGHYIPPKKRNKRNELLLKVICGYTARLFLGSLFSDKLITDDEEFKQQHELFDNYPKFQEPFEKTIETLQTIIFELFHGVFKGKPIFNGLLKSFSSFLENNFFVAFAKDKWEDIKKEYMPKWDKKFNNIYKYWSNYITNTLPDYIENYEKLEGRKLQPDEANALSEEIIQKIAHSLMHEDTVENRMELMDCLREFMNESKYQQYIKVWIEKVRKYLSEVSADVFMCSVLGLTDMEYRKLVTGYAERMFGISLQDILQCDNNNKDHVSLLSRVLTVFDLFSEKSAVNKVGNTEEESWMNKPVMNSVSQYNNTIDLEDIKKYLSGLKDFYKENLLSESDVWSNIRDLNEAYRDLVTGVQEDRFGRQMAFIDKFWEFGLQRWNKKRQQSTGSGSE